MVCIVTVVCGSAVVKAEDLLINIENPTRCRSVPNFISYLLEAQHVSGDTPPIVRSLKLH
jgi:hypothetical protein